MSRRRAPRGSRCSWPAGVGTRVGLDIPKQLIKIAGKTILEHTLAAFQAAPDGRRDRGDDGRRATSTRCARWCAAAATTRSPRSSRAPTPATARRCGPSTHLRRRLPGALPRRRAPAGQRADHHRVLRGARAATTPSTSRSRRPTRSSRSRPTTTRSGRSRRAPTCAAARPRRRSAPRCSGRRTTWPAQDPDFTATDDCGVVLRYLPDVPIWVVAGEERNMKVTDPIDVFLADKLFQLTSRYVPEGHSAEEYRARPRRQGDRRARRQLRHRRRHRRPGPRARRDRRDVQPLQHQHPRRAALRPGRGRASR